MNITDFVFSRAKELLSYLKQTENTQGTVLSCAIATIAILGGYAFLKAVQSYRKASAEMILESDSGTVLLSKFESPKIRKISAEPIMDFGPFPFLTDTLSSIENAEEWIKKTGITPDEAILLDKYIQTHQSQWGNLEGVLRISKEESALPRSIHVYREYGRLCVQVLCKTKNHLKMVGAGKYKIGKVSVEWLTKTLWVQYVVYGHEERDRVSKGLIQHDRLNGHATIFPSPKGRSSYINNNNTTHQGSVKLSMFAPLREGDAISCLKELKKQKLFTTYQLLSALCILEKNNVMHNDVRLNNLFFYMRDGKIYLELGDFDLAIEWPRDLEDYRMFCGGRDKAKFDITSVCTLLKIIRLDDTDDQRILELMRMFEQNCSAKAIFEKFIPIYQSF